MCYEIEKTIKQQGDKLKDTDKTALESAIARVREAAKGEDVGGDQERRRRPRNGGPRDERSAVQSRRRRRRAGAAPGERADGGDGASRPSADDDAIDAEFEVKS